MENSAPERQQVRVTILSRPYTLLTTGDSREVEEVAASVNELMLVDRRARRRMPIPRASPCWPACIWPTGCGRWSAISANSRSAWTARARSSPVCWNNSSKARENSHDAGVWHCRALAGVALFAASSYQTEIADWRRQREENLKREGGWLSVAGLFWLHEGANSFGKDPGNEIVLPDGPAKAGVFELHDGKVTVKMDGASARTVARFAGCCQSRALEPVRHQAVGKVRHPPQGSGKRIPPRISRASNIIPAQEEYRVTAKWVAAPQKIPILNILGPDGIGGQSGLRGVSAPRQGVPPSSVSGNGRRQGTVLCIPRSDRRQGDLRRGPLPVLGDARERPCSAGFQ